MTLPAVEQPDTAVPAGSDSALAANAVGASLASGGTAWLVGPAAAAGAGLRGRGLGDRARAVAHDAGAVAAVRREVRAGDIVLLGASATDPVAIELCVRALAWGARTVWVVAGSRPAPGRADHIVWSEDATPLPFLVDAFGRDLADTPFVVGPVDTSPGETCITCADEGIVSEVVRVLDDATALVRDPDGERTVDTTLVGPVVEHDLVLVHAGTAISGIDIPGPGGRL